MTTSIEVPGTGDYRIDHDNSTVSFTTRHMFGLGAVRGTFRLRDGHIHVASPVADTATRVTISAGGFDTGVSARDVTVRSATYLDTETHPDITFVSTRLGQAEQGWVLHGSLAVRGLARPLDVHIDEVRPAGSGLRLLAGARVDRYAFGITAMKGFAGRYLTMRLDVAANRM
jgi:polyisoprenoid-binding protein YceI